MLNRFLVGFGPVTEKQLVKVVCATQVAGSAPAFVIGCGLADLADEGDRQAADLMGCGVLEVYRPSWEGSSNRFPSRIASLDPAITFPFNATFSGWGREFLT